jgi:hypothetical protein
VCVCVCVLHVQVHEADKLGARKVNFVVKMFRLHIYVRVCVLHIHAHEADNWVLGKCTLLWKCFAYTHTCVCGY